MPRPTRRFSALVGGALLLFLIGTNIQSGWLFVLSALLLGAAIGGLLLPRWMVRGIEISRSAPLEATQGVATQVRLEVTNASRGVAWLLVVDDDHLARTRLLVGSVAPNERVFLDGQRVPARRGTCTTSSVTVTSTAPFGVGRARATIEVSTTTTVLPAWTELPAPAFVAPAPAHDRTLHSRARRGTGPEYLGIREYRFGDSMRHVHWPSTARTGSVMVREFEQEQRPVLVLVVDTLADRGLQNTPLDRCCSIVASWALAAMRAGVTIRLAAGVAGRLEVLEDADPHRVLRWLADLPRSGGLGLAEVLGALAPRLDVEGGVLVAAPTWRANDAERFPPALRGLAPRAQRLAVALVDADAYEGEPTAPILGAADATRLTESLLVGGVDAFRVLPDDELSDVLPDRHRWGG
ncbi:MAG: DUF58 domain-containing protein [Actinomycetota bacterium]